MTREREDGKEEMVVRAKWTFDGANSIEDMAEKLEQKAKALRELDEDGWELEDEVRDDYAFLIRDK